MSLSIDNLQASFLNPTHFDFASQDENNLAEKYALATYREGSQDEFEVEPLKNSFTALHDQLALLDTCRTDVAKLPVVGWLSSTSPFDAEIAKVFLVLDMSHELGKDIERLFTAIKKMDIDETPSRELYHDQWSLLNSNLRQSLGTIYTAKMQPKAPKFIPRWFALLVKKCGQNSFHLSLGLALLALILAITLASCNAKELAERWIRIVMAVLVFASAIMVWSTGPASDYWYQITQTNFNNLDRQRQYHLGAYKELYRLLVPGQLTPSNLNEMKQYIRCCRKTFVAGWTTVPAIKQALTKPSASL